MKTELFYLKTVFCSKIVSLPALVLLAAGIISGAAHAADGKDYPATHCMPKDSDQAFVATTAGAIMNPSGTKSLTVICPGVNDVGTKVTGVVTVFDANPSTTTTGQDLAPVRCTLESRARGGVVLGQSTRQTAIGEGVTALSFNTPVNNQANAYFYYVCTLPPAAQNPLRFSQIFSYEFDEQ